MAYLNPATGLWEDDENGPASVMAGSLGEQASAPVIPSPPPPAVGTPGNLDRLPLGDLPMVPGQGAPGVAPPALPVSATGNMPRQEPPLPDVKPVGMPAAPPPIPPGRAVSPAEAQNLGAIDANTGARQQTAADQGGVKQFEAQAKVEQADREAADAAAKQAERQKLENDWSQRIAQREQQAQQDYQQYKSFGIKDPDADESIGHRLLKAIAVFAGGYAAGINGGPNHALEIFQKAASDNIARQKAQQEKLLQVSERSGKDVDEARKLRDDSFKQLDLKHAAMLDSGAAMLRQQLARAGVPQAQIDTNADIQKLEAESLQKRETTLASIRGDETALARADIAAQARKKKAGAGGGAGGTDALTKFVESAGALQPGDPIPPELAVLGRQAGLKPNQIAGEVDKYRGSGAKAAKGGIGQDRLVSAESKAWAQQNQLPAITKKQQELSAVLDEVKNAPHNPLQQALAIEKAVSSARGGAASRQALDLALHHLGGKWDSMEALVQGARSGEVGPKQMENFIGFMSNQLGTAQKEGKDKYDAFNQYIESVPDQATKARLLQERSRLFSGLHGFGAHPATSAADGGPKPDKGAGRSELSDAQAWVAANPKDPRATQVRAKIARMLMEQ